MGRKLKLITYISRLKTANISQSTNLNEVSLAFSTTKEVVVDPVENFIESINSGSVAALSSILVLNEFEKDSAIEFTENRLDDAAVGTTALRTAGEGLFPLDCQTPSGSVVNTEVITEVSTSAGCATCSSSDIVSSFFYSVLFHLSKYLSFVQVGLM